MEKIRIGIMLYRIRMEKKITRKQLCGGLCQLSTMSYYENGERVPDSLLFHYFMQRLGTSPEDYAIMLNEKEYHYYLWKEKTLVALKEKKWYLLERLMGEEEALQIKCNDRIQKQYYYFLKAMLAQQKEKIADMAVKYLRLAAEQTIPDIFDIASSSVLLGTTELEILIIYLFLGTRDKILKIEVAERLFMELEQYIRDGFLEMHEQAKVYPKLICIWLRLKGKTVPVKQRRIWCQKGVELLKNSGALYDIAEVLRLYVENLKETGEEKAIIFEKQYEAIKEVLEQRGEDTVFRPEIFYGRKPKLYMLHEYLCCQRMIKGITQEKISEGICEPENYSRLERGIRTPTLKNYKALAGRLGIGWGYYRGELVADNLEVYEQRREQRRAVVEERWEEDRMLLARMKQKLDMELPENRQYIEGKQNMAELQLGILTASQVYQKDKELLQLTMDADSQDAEIYCYSQTELELVAHMAMMLRIQKKHEEGIELLERTLERLRRSSIDLEFRWNGAGCVIRVLSGLYFDVGNYERSLEMAETDYRMGLETRDAGTLGWALDAIADNLEHMDEKNKSICKKLYQQAVYVNDFFGRYSDSEVIKRYYQEKFDSTEKWY